MNSGSDLAFTGILFLFFNGKSTVFVQFRQSTVCRPTILCDVLSVLFAVTPICCTRGLNQQRDVCDVSLHFVPQVAFNKLNMLLIFFAMFERTFSSMPCTFYLQWIDPQWENGQYLDCDQRWGSMTAADQRHVHTQFFIFFICHQIQDESNKMMFVIFMNNTRQHNTNFTFTTFPKSKIHAGKLQLGHTLLSPFIVKQPYYNVWRCSNIKFSCLYNYQQTYSY